MSLDIKPLTTLFYEDNFSFIVSFQGSNPVPPIGSRHPPFQRRPRPLLRSRCHWKVDPGESVATVSVEQLQLDCQLDNSSSPRAWSWLGMYSTAQPFDFQKWMLIFWMHDLVDSGHIHLMKPFIAKWFFLRRQFNSWKDFMLMHKVWRWIEK